MLNPSGLRIKLCELRIGKGFDIHFVVEDENFRARRSLINRQYVSIHHPNPPSVFSPRGAGITVAQDVSHGKRQQFNSTSPGGAAYYFTPSGLQKIDRQLLLRETKMKSTRRSLAVLVLLTILSDRKSTRLNSSHEWI